MISPEKFDNAELRQRFKDTGVRHNDFDLHETEALPLVVSPSHRGDSPMPPVLFVDDVAAFWADYHARQKAEREEADRFAGAGGDNSPPADLCRVPQSRQGGIK